MKDDLTFGQRLRRTRVQAGMSQAQLERVSGIPKARLSRYENGHVAPSLGTLGRLAMALHVSEATLLGDQRAPLEAFFTVLYDRGVRVTSTEQAERLGHAVADVVLMAGPHVIGTLTEPSLAEEPPLAEPPHVAPPEALVRALSAVDHPAPVE